MQFIVLAYDGTDGEALDRRMQAREEHLRLVKDKVEAGEHLYGAALLDEEGKMIGSMMVVEYPSREALEDWLKVEPYVMGNVWQEIDIKPCQVPPVFMK